MTIIILYIILFMFFMWCIVSPFMPKEKKAPTIVHNTYYITDNRVQNSNNKSQYNEYKQLYYEPINKQNKINEGR